MRVKRYNGPYWRRRTLVQWLFYSAPVGERILQSLPISLSLRLSASISMEPLDRSSPIFCAYPLWPWFSPSLVALRYVMYFRFCGRRHIWPWWALWRSLLQHRDGVSCLRMPCFEVCEQLSFITIDNTNDLLCNKLTFCCFINNCEDIWV